MHVARLSLYVRTAFTQALTCNSPWRHYWFRDYSQSTVIMFMLVYKMCWRLDVFLLVCFCFCLFRFVLFCFVLFCFVLFCLFCLFVCLFLTPSWTLDPFYSRPAIGGTGKLWEAWVEEGAYSTRLFCSICIFLKWGTNKRIDALLHSIQYSLWSGG